jgi:ferric-dicitrate binding protein FerR (iron transport regulator)
LVIELKTTDLNDLGEMILSESFREFVEGTNPESIRIWNDWISVHPEKKEALETAVEVLRTLMNTRKSSIISDKNKSLSDLMKFIDEEKPESEKTISFFNSIWFKIAAVSLLLIGISLFWNILRHQNNPVGELAYNEIIVPLGEKAQIILSDGSHVWINSASKLRYPVMFGETSRDVTLEGEAFFDVVKKHGKTFVVNTRDVKVNVLGTAFNVKCYPGDEKTQTIVVRGEVKVENIHGDQKSIIIKPNEMATIQNRIISDQTTSHLNSITVRKVDPESLVSWKDQLLVFNGESFEDLAIKMGRWFNVRIKIDNVELKTERYSGKFVHNETVYQVLEAIKITTPIVYKVEKDTIIISKIQRKK